MKATKPVCEDYRSQGFLVVEDLLADAELEEIRVAVEEVSRRVVEQAAGAAKGARFGRSVGLTSIPELGIRGLAWEGEGLDVVKVIEPVTQADERLSRLWEHPAIVDIARVALGVDDVAPFTDKLNAKRARTGGEFMWHQDHPFWYSIIRERAGDTVTVMLALDAATESNGAMVVVPGTQHGPLPRRKDAAEVMGRYHADERAIDTEAAITAPVPAGGALVFGPLLLHRSGANQTDGDRRALLLTYPPAGRPPLAEFDYETALLSEQWMDELP
jgi:hypothetical protein